MSLLALVPAPIGPNAGAGILPALPPCENPELVFGAIAESALADYSEDPHAGRARTWYVEAYEVPVAQPPLFASPTTALELATMREREARRTDADLETIARWDGPATRAWEEAFLSLVPAYTRIDPALTPPRIARQIAILEIAMYDALVATWAWKHCYLRPPPSVLDPTLRPAVVVPNAPSYPSEHAAAAGAAATVLAAFYPDPLGVFPRLAREAADSRVAAGASWPSDVEAGLALGAEVAERILAERAHDGSAETWDGTGRLLGPCNWAPTPPGYQATPAEPAWGGVEPFLMSTGSQFRPPPPAPCDGAAYAAQMRDLHEASLALNDRQREIADFWAGGPGTVTPPGLNLALAMRLADEHDLSTMRRARVQSYLGAALADAGIAAWDAKYAFWGDRPVLGIRRTIDPAWTPYLPTPPFPGYVSGHATFSGAATEALSAFYPEEAPMLRASATEAALSRFYGGIHIREDNERGLEVGNAIGDLARARAATDGGR